MDEIIAKAADLGKKIQQTAIYIEYKDTLEEVERNPEASDLMTKYNLMVEGMQQRMQSGDIIESFEKVSLKDLTLEIENNPLLTDFLKAQKKYTDFLTEIQQELSGK